MAGKGGAMPGGGRPTAVQEYRTRQLTIAAIVRKYGSLEDGLEALLNSGDNGLIRWVFEHALGKPREVVDVTSNGQEIKNYTIEIVRHGQPVDN